MNRLAICLLLPGLVSGCHAKFKKHHHLVDEVRTQVYNTGPAQVSLGYLENEDGDLVTGLVNVVQTVKGFDVAKTISEAAEPTEMNAAFAEQLASDLGAGPPFASTEQAQAVLEVSVERWGLSVPTVGARGTFDYQVRVRVFLADGERIYTHRVSCGLPVGDPKGVSQALGAVNNKKQIDRMDRDAIREAFNEAARGCASVVVSDLRRHAG